MDVIQQVLPSTLPGGQCLPGRTPYMEVLNLNYLLHILQYPINGFYYEKR
jgi:hypothetical protein